MVAAGCGWWLKSPIRGLWRLAVIVGAKANSCCGGVIASTEAIATAEVDDWATAEADKGMVGRGLQRLTEGGAVEANSEELRGLMT